MEGLGGRSAAANRRVLRRGRAARARSSPRRRVSRVRLEARRRGWVASNQEMTHRVLGVRADRVVAHGDAPPGFLVHGGPTVLWTAYVNGGDVPRGDTFRSVVARARRSSRRRRRRRSSERSHAIAGASCSTTSSGCAAASCTGRQESLPACYLQNRGFPAEAIDRSRPRRRSSGAVHEERSRGGRLLGTRDRAVRSDRGWPLARKALRRLARRARTNRNVLGSFASRLRLLDALPLPPRREPL